MSLWLFSYLHKVAREMPVNLLNFSNDKFDSVLNSDNLSAIFLFIIIFYLICEIKCLTSQKWDDIIFKIGVIMNTKLINVYMAKNEVTKEQLAKACNMSLSTLYNILKNKHNTGMKYIIKLASVMNVSVDSLLTENDWFFVLTTKPLS